MEKLLKIKEYTLWSLSLPTGEGFIFTQEQSLTGCKFLCVDGEFRYALAPFSHEFGTLQEVLAAFQKYIDDTPEHITQVLTQAFKKYLSNL